MKGEAGGDWGSDWRGEIGWKEKCLRLVPGEGGTGQVLEEAAGAAEVAVIAAGSETIRGLKDTLLLLERFVLRLRAEEVVRVGSRLLPEVATSCFKGSCSDVLLKAPPPPHTF